MTLCKPPMIQAIQITDRRLVRLILNGGQEELNLRQATIYSHKKLNSIFLQFTGAAAIRDFESRHYVRKMTDDENRSKFSKEVGAPRGHHGQQIHYLIWYKLDDGTWKNVGAISGGSAVYSTKLRDDFFGITKENRQMVLNGIIDNTLFRLELPEQNLASKVVSMWRKQVALDWEEMYDVKPFGFETFVEYAELENNNKRLGSLYRADNWTFVGETDGNTKNHVGKGLGGGFNRENVSKKKIFCKWIKPFKTPQICEYKSSWKGETPEQKKIAGVRKAKRKDLEIKALVKKSNLGII